jgi:hypothetical protein
MSAVGTHVRAWHFIVHAALDAVVRRAVISAHHENGSAGGTLALLRRFRNLEAHQSTCLARATPPFRSATTTAVQVQSPSDCLS